MGMEIFKNSVKKVNNILNWFLLKKFVNHLFEETCNDIIAMSK